MPGKLRKHHLALKPRFRVVRGETIALGPGKMLLLARVAETGSLSQAARELDMSYMRAWTLVKTMNRCFREPLLMAARGGKSGGGMELTQTGQRALALYQEMEAEALRATQRTWRKLQILLQD